jgi:hypothetical protein
MCGGMMVVWSQFRSWRSSLISAQVLMLMERGRSMRRRLRDLSWGGDAASLLLVAALMTGAVGAVVGSFRDGAVIGGAAGMIVALLGWAVAVAWAHRQPESPRHRMPEQ